MVGRHEGKVALVTGGANGIGRGCVERFVADGASVVIADIDMDEARAVEARCGAKSAAVECDVRDEAQCEAAVAEAVQRFGRLDFMVNNAGYIIYAPVVETDAAEWRRLIDVNITGIFLSMKAGAKRLIEQGEGGAIVNASSGAGRHGVPNLSAYCSTKAAIIMLSQAASGELAEHRIRVNCYTPGHTETPLMFRLLDTIAEKQGMTQDEAYDMLLSTVPWGRWGQPSDVASAVSWLCSDDAEYITGQCIGMNGGELPW